jgi:hypothetical protein
MSTQLVDNFQVNTTKPIDSRFVVGPGTFYLTRNDIVYKYPGLRIWDLNDSIPYVWDGSSWISENTVAISGVGTVARIPKFTLSTVVGDSLITDSGTYVGVGYANETLASEKLDVNGNIKSNGVTGFIGFGGSITQLNATNVATGTLSLARVQNDSLGKVLITGASSPQWENTSNISVGTASTIAVSNDTASATTHYISFFSAITGGTNKVSSSRLQFIPSSGNLYVFGNLGLGYATPANKLTINGSLTVGSNVAITGGTNRCWFNSGPNGGTGVYNSGAFQIGPEKQFEFFTFTGTGGVSMAIYNTAAGSSARLIFQNFSTYSSFVVRDLHYFNTISSSGIITLGGGGNDQFRFYMSGRTDLPTIGGAGLYVQEKTFLNGRAHLSSGLSTGVGSLIKNIYIIHTEVKRNLANSSYGVNNTTGFDYLGNPVTYTYVSSVTNQSLTFRLNFPTAFPNTNYYCFVNCDNNNDIVNDYKFQTLVVEKTTTFIEVFVIASARINDSTTDWVDDFPVGISVAVFGI